MELLTLIGVPVFFILAGVGGVFLSLASFRRWRRLGWNDGLPLMGILVGLGLVTIGGWFIVFIVALFRSGGIDW
jgi:hypothetical protein